MYDTLRPAGILDISKDRRVVEDGKIMTSLPLHDKRIGQHAWPVSIFPIAFHLAVSMLIMGHACNHPPKETYRARFSYLAAGMSQRKGQSEDSHLAVHL